MKLTTPCPICNKTLELQSEFPVSETEILNTYKCGHCFIQPKVFNSVLNEEGKNFSYPTKSTDLALTTRDYQNEAIEFIHDPMAYLDSRSIDYIGTNTGFNCLIADQMGLGKTIEGLLALRSEYETKTPCLILVKTATVWQWIKEYKKWADPAPLGIFLIEGSKSWIPPGFKTYILPMDTFSRIAKTPEGMQKLLEFGFKLLIVDEVHSFKNASSSRTQALVSFIKEISHREIKREAKFNCNLCGKSWSEEITIEVDLSRASQHATNLHTTHCPQCGAQISQRTDKIMLDDRDKGERIGLIFLSGTPIKNRAEEFFVPLNLLAPERFPSLERFRRRFLQQSDTGKWTKVHPHKLIEFRDSIAPYVLRRERKDVLKDLPKFQRIFTTVFIDDENMKAAYNREIDKLKEKDADKDFSIADVQENIFTMRRIIGMAKVKFAANYIKEFIDESEDEKIAVGIHHHSVRDALVFELTRDANKDYHPIRINAGKDIQHNVDRWKAGEKRVAVLSQLAGGVGLNLQFCSNLLSIERQWNSADEEQLEDRFNRIGQENPVTAEYLVARGTIDMWFSNMVEEKRIISGETYGVNFDPMESKETIKEMIQWAMVNKL